MLNTIADLQQLKVWKFLGISAQSAIKAQFDVMAADQRNLVISSLEQLEEVYVEVVSETNEATFIQIMQQSLVNVMDELIGEVKKVKKEVWDQKEAIEHEQELADAEAVLAQLN